MSPPVIRPKSKDPEVQALLAAAREKKTLAEQLTATHVRAWADDPAARTASTVILWDAVDRWIDDGDGAVSDDLRVWVAALNGAFDSDAASYLDWKKLMASGLAGPLAPTVAAVQLGQAGLAKFFASSMPSIQSVTGSRRSLAEALDRVVRDDPAAADLLYETHLHNANMRIPEYAARVREKFREGLREWGHDVTQFVQTSTSIAGALFVVAGLAYGASWLARNRRG